MAACPPRCSKLRPTPKLALVVSLVYYCGKRMSPSSLTVVLLQHFFVQQLGHDIIFDIHQEQDVRETDTAPGLTPNPWNLTLAYDAVETL